MADKTGIEWTDATWNPLRGCSRVSKGCQHCYAERVAARFSGAGQPYEGLIHPATKGWNGQIKLFPEALQIPWRWARGRRIFVNSMSDLFHESVPFEFIASVFFVMAHTTRHTYQVLTKRPERMVAFFTWLLDRKQDWMDEDDDGKNSAFYPLFHPHAQWLMDLAISDVAGKDPAVQALGWEPARAAGGGQKGTGGYDNCGPGWPYQNVWLGVSVEDQATADERIPLLMKVPAAVRWISAEPLLGAVDLRLSAPSGEIRTMDRLGLGWVVAGGESGPGARPMHPDWARSLRDQCAAAGVPFLFKQWGAYAPNDTRGDRIFVYHDGETDIPDDRWPDPAINGETHMAPMGKKAAGRLLDGQLHDGYPA